MKKETENILNKLFELESHCMHCRSKTCQHTNRALNNSMDVDNVLKAIAVNDPEYQKELES